VDNRLLDATLAVGDLDHRDLIIIEGGDGTLQKTLTRLIGHFADRPLPLLAVIPAGTTNMSCADFNRSRRYAGAVATLRRIIEGQPAETISKALVRVRHGEQTAYGFCFCLGIIVDAVLQFSKVRTRDRLHDQLMMAGLVGRAMLRTHTAVQVDAGGARHDVFAMVATTLDRLIYGMKAHTPGDAPTGLHTTWIGGDAPDLWRRLPALARGDPSLFGSPGFESRDVPELELRFPGPFVMDGEVFDQPGTGVHISLSPPVRFVVL
jgi:diacylglycerol kinase family enzyme